MSEIEKDKDKGLHKRNIHTGNYDFDKLVEALPELKKYIKQTPAGKQSIDFSNQGAVIALNQALLKVYYQVENWLIPKGSLCPPIPGRVDYIHHVADLIAGDNSGVVPNGIKVKGLDIGVGANCVYPIIASRVYGWKFVGVDSDSIAINHAKTIIKANKTNLKNIKIRFQGNSKSVLEGTMKADEYFDFTVCNPPFFTSREEAIEENSKKLRGLAINSDKSYKFNFGGRDNELWCEGGEKKFISNMIEESIQLADNCTWFTTLVSNKENLEPLQASLAKTKAAEVKVIDMQHGNKKSRVLAWTFLNKKKRKSRSQERWS